MRTIAITMIGFLALQLSSFSAHASSEEEITFTIPSSSPESTACESAEAFTWGLVSSMDSVTLNDVKCSRDGENLQIVTTVVRDNSSAPTPLMNSYTYTLDEYIQGEMVRGATFTFFGKSLIEKMGATGKCLFTYRVSRYDESIVVCQ